MKDQNKGKDSDFFRIFIIILCLPVLGAIIYYFWTVLIALILLIALPLVIVVQGGSAIGVSLIIIQAISYIMSIWRWFDTDHIAFWDGFKELIWALCPIINITYIWDLWAIGIGYIYYWGFYGV